MFAWGLTPLLFAAWNVLEWGGRTSVQLRMVPLEMVQALRGCQLSRHSCLNVVCAGHKQCEILRAVLLCSWIGWMGMLGGGEL